jgi:hypothetical protein
MIEICFDLFDLLLFVELHEGCRAYKEMSD